MSPITSPRFRVPRGFVYFLGMKEIITTVDDWLVHGPFKCIHLTLRLLREVTHNLVYLYLLIYPPPTSDDYLLFELPICHGMGELS